MPRAAKPFASLSAALRAFDARDLCGDIDIIAADATPAQVALLADARDALMLAESVETARDFVANLGEAAALLAQVPEAVALGKRVSRFAARCPQ
mgnify:CR=1 FL=1